MKKAPLLTIEQAVAAARRVAGSGQRGAIDASVVEVSSIAVLADQLVDIAEAASALLGAADRARTPEDCETVTLIEVRLRQVLGHSGFLTDTSFSEQRGN